MSEEKKETYYSRHRERLLAQAKEYRLKHLDYYTEYNKTYYRENADKLKANHRNWFQKNKQKAYQKYNTLYGPKHQAKKKGEVFQPPPPQINFFPEAPEPTFVIQEGNFLVTFS